MSMVPPCRWMTPYAIARPRPVPRSPFVVKNGSRQRRRTSSVMPTPVSVTRSVTAERVSSSPVSMVSVPPPRMASTALKIRLVRTSRSAVALPSTARISPSSRVDRDGAAARLGLGLPPRPRQRHRHRDQLVDVHRHEHLDLVAWPVELAQAADELGGALAGGVDHLQAVPDPGAVVQVAGPQQQHAAEPHHGRHRVGEVVDDAAGHLAQRAEPLPADHLLPGQLDLPQLRLEAQDALGHPDARVQLVDVEGLGDEVVRPRLHGLEVVLLAARAP